MRLGRRQRVIRSKPSVLRGWWSGGEAAPDETVKGDYYMKERPEEIVMVTLRAPASLIRQVDTIARRDGVSRADVLRMALRSGLIAGPRRGFLRVSDGDAAGVAS